MKRYHVSKNKSLVDNINNRLSNQYYKDVLVCENLPQGQYTISFTDYTGGTTHRFSIGVGTSTYQTDIGMSEEHEDGYQSGTFTITAANAGKNLYMRFVRYLTPTTVSYTVSNIMLNTGSTALPYEPFETDNLFDWGLFSSTYPDNTSFINGVFDVSTPNTTMFNTGVSVNIPADTTFSCTAIAKVGQAVNGRVKFVFDDSTIIDVKITNEYGEIIDNIQSSFNKAIVSIRLDWSTFNNGFSFKLAMLNKGSTALPYTPYGSTWQTKSPPKYGTASETIQSGDTIYADGTAITSYTIKGNTVQNGTPTPSNPVDVQGVGNKTANLLGYNRQRSNSFTTDENYYIYGGAANSTNTDTSPSNVSISISDNTISVYSRNGSGIGYIVEVQPNTTYTLSFDSDLTLPNKTYAALNLLTEGLQFGTLQTVYDKTYSFTTDNTTKYVYIVFRVVAETCVYSNIMLNTGNTALPYEHYGYKIPILNGQQTTPVYLTEQLMKVNNTADSFSSSGTATYNIIKQELTGSESVNFNSRNSQAQIAAFVVSLSTTGTTTPENVISSHLVTRSSASEVLNTGGVIMRSTGTHIVVGFGYNIIGVDDVMTNAECVDKMRAYLAQQYAAGTPVTVWYVLATPTTESVTAPTIPTTEGANQISIDTTVQPSEFTATWTGWHNASVQEYVGGVVNKFNINTTWNPPTGQTATITVSGESVTITGKYYAYVAIPVTANGTYTAKYSGTGDRVYVVAYRDMPFNTANMIAGLSTSGTTINVGNTDTLYILFYSGDGTQGTTTYSDIMLVEGSTVPSEYHPYYEWV